MFTSGWWPLLHCLFCNSSFSQSHWCAVGFKPNGSQSGRKQLYSGSLITAHLLSQSVRSPDVLLQIQWCLWKQFLLDGSFDTHPPSKTHMQHHSLLITKWTFYNLFMEQFMRLETAVLRKVCFPVRHDILMFLNKAIGSLAPAAARLCYCVQWERESGERPESESCMAAGNLEKRRFCTPTCLRNMCRRRKKNHAGLKNEPAHIFLHGV